MVFGECKMESSTINIRFANEQDAEIIATIHVASWQKIYRGHIPDAVLDNISVKERYQMWHALIKNNVKILVIEKNKKIVGFASLCASRDDDTNQKNCGEISAIYLNPDVWHQGLGKQLCQRVFVELKKMGFNEVILWVLKENTQANRFYESIGFIATEDTKSVKYDNEVILNEIRYRKSLTNHFSFKPLQENDLSLLCKWFDKPHVKEWWNDNLSHDEIKTKYGKRIGDKTVHPFIVNLNDKPIGFIQYYYATQVGGGWWPNEVEGTVGIDQFIGEENCINRGLGTQMITAFTRQLFLMSDIKKIITEADPNNKRAIRCYKKAGFNFVKELDTPNGLAYLFELERTSHKECQGA